MRRLPDFMTMNDFDRFMKVVHKDHHKAAFVLGFTCGLRISEIVNLKQENIDRGRGVLKIRGKGDKDRIVPYNKRVARYLKYIPIKCGVRSLQIGFKRALARSGLDNPKLHFHSLRHSFASNRLAKGYTLKEVQELMGHSNISTTNVYLHTNPEELIKKVQEDTW